jgi:hypothetical protein
MQVKQLTHLSLLIVITPFCNLSAPEMQDFTHRGSSQCLQDTAKQTDSASSTLILGVIFLFFSALAMSFSPVAVKAQ